MSETSTIVSPAIEALNGIPYVVAYRVHAGTLRVGRHYVHQNKPGAVDIMCTVRGVPLAIECKLPGEKPTPEQLREHARLKLAGATVVVAHSVADCIEAVRWALRQNGGASCRA
jgi:hypothetical protein